MFFLFILCLIISYFSFSQAQPDPLCGPKSLLVICQKLGVNTTLEELAILSDFKEKPGTSMLGLYQAAQKKGLYAVGMKIGVDDLAKRQVPAIAHLWDNHFVVVEATVGETLLVTDPPNNPRAVSKDEFQNLYSGFALLISKDKNLFPRIEIKGADIRFDEYIINVGVIEEGKKIEKIFTFRNAGKTNLEISNVRATCGCTPTDITDKSIKPEGSGKIKVIFDTTGRQGLQNHKIYVLTNDPVTPIVQLQIRGLIKEDLVITPRSVAFGDIKKASPPTREILIIDRTGKNVEITGLEPYPEFITTILSPVTDRPYQGHKILVFLSPEAPLCNMEGKVTIYTTDKKHSEIEIPVTANIIGDIEFRPSLFFFGFVKQGETPVAKITIFTTGEESFRIEGIENDTHFISTEIIPKEAGREYIISATLNKDTPPGNMRSTVSVHTSNPEQPEIRIPVYGLVK